MYILSFMLLLSAVKIAGWLVDFYQQEKRYKNLQKLDDKMNALTAEYAAVQNKK